MEKNAARIYSLDNLKWSIVWLMVIFHAAMCYMAYAPEWWYVVDTAQPLFSATVFICWVDIFIMPVMFFISGYFGLMSLSKQGMRVFWKKKFSRIVLPWLFGSLFIAPFVAYLMLASRQSPMGFWEFYRTLFWGPAYQQIHYWYLGALTALYILLCLLCLARPSLMERGDPRQPRRAGIAGLFLLFTVSIGAISSTMHPDTWTFYGYVLVLQPVRVPMYIAVFLLGAWAWRHHWFKAEGWSPAPLPWGVAFAVSGVLYLWQKFCLSAHVASPVLTVWINAVCQAGFTLSALFFLLAFFHRWLNLSTSVTSALSATSYGVYYVHQPILFPIVWLFTIVPLDAYLKFLCVCVLSLGLCFLLAHRVLAKLPCFAEKRY